jgi:hypothetical protein
MFSEMICLSDSCHAFFIMTFFKFIFTRNLYYLCYFLLVYCCQLPFNAIIGLQFAVKRKAVGIWGCKDCGKVKAGGAYTMKYVLNFVTPFIICSHKLLILCLCIFSTASAVTVRSTIRPLREQTEA